MSDIQYDLSNGFPASGLVIDEYGIRTQVVNGNQTRVRLFWDTRLNRSGNSLVYRWYVMKEAAL